MNFKWGWPLALATVALAGCGGDDDENLLKAAAMMKNVNGAHVGTVALSEDPATPGNVQILVDV
ncbi:MAG: hypothetical protein KY468_18635, partial [Armatimonadetes bacterium]|nr:hypothetical protein [Armatimonadota bacterium]